LYLSFPLAVTLNLLAIPLWVFILGIAATPKTMNTKHNVFNESAREIKAGDYYKSVDLLSHGLTTGGYTIWLAGSTDFGIITVPGIFIRLQCSGEICGVRHCCLVF